MEKKGKGNPLSALILEGEKSSEQVKGKTASDINTNKVIEEDNSSKIQEDKNTPLSVLNTDSESFRRFLFKRGGEAHEVVRFPSSLHSRLKLISVATGIPLYMIVTNIVEEALNNNEKEIDKILKSSISK